MNPFYKRPALESSIQSPKVECVQAYLVSAARKTAFPIEIDVTDVVSDEFKRNSPKEVIKRDASSNVSARRRKCEIDVGFDRPAARYEEKLLREMLDGLEADQRRIGGIISERTSILTDEVQELFRGAQTKTAEFARQRGIIDDIREFDLPEGASVVSFVFQR